MDVIQQKRRFRITAGVIILISIFLCGSSIISGKFIPIYFLEGALAIAVMVLSNGVLIHRKRMSLFTFLLFAAGFVFMASAAISYGYINAVETLSVLQQMEFSRILRPQQISSGLANIGFGTSNIALFLFDNQSSFFKKNKRLLVFWLVMSILILLIGVKAVIDGSGRL